MAITRKRKTKSTKQDSIDSVINDPFDTEFHVVDAAVSGALIGGLDPNSFNSTLSFFFLHTIAETRKLDQSDFDRWTMDADFVWYPILDAVKNFCDNFKGPLDSTGLRELKFLKENCGIRKSELSEIEAHRQSNETKDVIEYTLTLMSKTGYDAIALEKSLFLAWVKTAVLSDQLEERTFLIVRQNMPTIFEMYDDILWNSMP